MAIGRYNRPPIFGAPMLAHCNRWLLPAAVVYLAVMVTNALNFWRSVSFTVGGICAAIVVIAGLRGKAPRVPGPGRVLLASYVAWCLWSLASVTWSIRPHYSMGQLRGEVFWTSAVVLMIYVAAADARAFRIMVYAVLGTFGLSAAFAVLLQISGLGWDPGRWHLGVGPWTTYLVLVAPLLLLLVVPPPVGLAWNRRSYVFAGSLLALILTTARIADNRMVWVGLATTIVVAGVLATFRWRRAHTHAARLRWLLPLMLLLIVAASALFTDAAREKAQVFFPPDTSIAQTLSEDPRLALWEHMVSHIRERPWIGYGFGRAILASELRSELGDPLLWHAHNMFGSQWLQTGAIGLFLFTCVLAAMAARYVGFYRSPDDAMAVLGMIGLAMLAGFLVKNLTDDFLFRANAKHFFALNALLIGWGMRRMRAATPATAVKNVSAVGARAAEAG